MMEPGSIYCCIHVPDNIIIRYSNLWLRRWEIPRFTAMSRIVNLQYHLVRVYDFMISFAQKYLFYLRSRTTHLLLLSQNSPLYAQFCETYIHILVKTNMCEHTLHT